MSRLVGRSAPKDELPATRRRRIEWALDVLRTQPFFPDPRLADRPDAPATFGFRCDDCASAAAAFRERLPKLAEVVKAISIAELEVDGAYVDAKHDPFFEHFDDSALGADEIAMFPDYLVCIPADRNDAPENAGLMDMLSAGLPVKVLTETTDLLEEASVGTGHFAFGVRSSRLANTATGLGGVFVVQTASSNLYALRERLAKALAHRGAGLVCVYAGAGATGDLPLYLTAAASMESRAFPAFTYDPYAGDNQAARFSLEDNPTPEADWPVEPFEYADENLQRVVEEMPFTVADFVLCDTRYAAHFARVPRERWNSAMIPADEWLARDPKSVGDAIPFVLAVDPDDKLQRVIVDSRLMQTVARSRTFWHRLQEQGGIHNSHAEILLAREKAKWEAAKAKELDEAKAAASAAGGAATRRRHDRRGDGRRPRRRDRRGGTGRRARRAGAQPGRGVDRHRALPELQRVPDHQRQDVQVQRQQAGLHRRPARRDLPPDGRGGRGLPGVDHPSRQAVESERARARRAAAARRGVQVAQGEHRPLHR